MFAKVASYGKHFALVFAVCRQQEESKILFGWSVSASFPRVFHQREVINDGQWEKGRLEYGDWLSVEIILRHVEISNERLHPTLQSVWLFGKQDVFTLVISNCGFTEATQIHQELKIVFLKQK